MVDINKSRNEIHDEATKITDAIVLAMDALLAARKRLASIDPEWEQGHLFPIAIEALNSAPAAIRAISSQPVANTLPQDVINLVIAAREAWETWQLPEEEFKRLDAALEAFASRVPYENEPDDLPASPGASE